MGGTGRLGLESTVEGGGATASAAWAGSEGGEGTWMAGSSSSSWHAAPSWQETLGDNRNFGRNGL
jgi:hypothetical protein